jgi:MFS family permease
MPARLAVIATVLRSRTLRRIEGGFLLFSIAEWATWLAVVVYAFDRGGAAEAGIVGFVSGLPSLVVAPAGALLGDRWPRAWVLLGSYILQSVAMAATALAMVLGPALVAYAFATLALTMVGLSRPALSSLLPDVVETPEALTAANVTSGVTEGAGALLGPLAAGLILGVSGPASVYVAAAVGVGVAALALRPIAAASEPIVLAGEDSRSAGLRASARTLGRDMAGGVAAIAADRRLAGVVAVLAASITLLGALGVFTLVIALDMLGLDEAAVGYLTAASGLGALAGSALSIVLVGRERLTWPLIVATAAFGLSVASLAFVRDPVIVTLVFVATGVGWSFAYVAATTLTQRLAGDDVMTRVFGVTESVMVAGESIGSLLVPVLILALGPERALLVAGLALPVVAILAMPSFLRADRAEATMLRELRVVRRIPMFRPLAAPVLERLASEATPRAVVRGERVITEGERGDRFFVVVTGRVGVSVGGAQMREAGPGEGFGEIALLHDIPRTATVDALEDTELLAIAREPFLSALTGQPRSRTIADRLATQRLARDPVAPASVEVEAPALDSDP